MTTAMTETRGDTRTRQWKINADLTNATAELRVQLTTGGEVHELPATIRDPANGIVEHHFDGSLLPGRYNGKFTFVREDERFSAPTSGFFTLVIEKNLEV